MELIPTLELCGGRCLREVGGDGVAGSCHELGPEELYERFSGLGARSLYVTDQDGIRDGAPAHRAVIEELARRGRLKLQVGGGLNARATLERTLSSGAARAVIGHRAVSDPDLVAGWIRRFGADAVVVAFEVRFDAAGLPRIAVPGSDVASPVILWDAVARFVRAGLRHVLCTDVDCEARAAGPNLELLIEAVRRFPALEWQAAGGIRDTSDLWALANAGAAAAISTRALLGAATRAAELKPFLAAS